MSRWQIYRCLRRQVKLSEKRNPMLEQSKVAKILMFIGGCMMAFYLLALGVGIGMMASESGEPLVLMSLLPIFLGVDFLHRLC